MLTLSAGRMAEVVGGEMVSGSGDTMVNGVSVDSRSIAAGCAFVAFGGRVVDGHAFAAEALRSGARALVVTRWDDKVASALEQGRSRDAAVIKVADASAAVTDLAIYHRSRLSCPVVGVTGSTGKTTTKDFLAAALATKLRVISTVGNRNNELGVPLTILDAGTETDVLIVEMGMRGTGQIAALCRIAKPTLGLVTNIGQTHMELLGSQEAIVHAKGELVACVPQDGCVFLNGDDVWSRELAGESAAKVVFYGSRKGNDVRFDDVVVDADGKPTMVLKAGRKRAQVSLPVPGRHNAYNAAAAAAVALELGLTLKDVADGLASASLTEWRMQVFTVASGVTVVNDAYNASPTSMRAAVTALADMRPEGRRVAVLGDMAELGSLAELAHFRLGEQVAKAGIDILVTVGPLAKHIADGARAAGMHEGAMWPLSTPDGASEMLTTLLEPGDIVLVKASRSVGLERVVEGIVQPGA